MPANNNISQGLRKFSISSQQKLCCIWGRGKDFGNFEAGLCQGKLFEKKC